MLQLSSLDSIRLSLPNSFEKLARTFQLFLRCFTLQNELFLNQISYFVQILYSWSDCGIISKFYVSSISSLLCFLIDFEAPSTPPAKIRLALLDHNCSLIFSSDLVRSQKIDEVWKSITICWKVGILQFDPFLAQKKLIEQPVKRHCLDWTKFRMKEAFDFSLICTIIDDCSNGISVLTFSE